VFDKNREVKEYYSDPSEWSVIPPESVTNSLSGKVCR
jgi:hypothetical protein